MFNKITPADIHVTKSQGNVTLSFKNSNQGLLNPESLLIFVSLPLTIAGLVEHSGFSLLYFFIAFLCPFLGSMLVFLSRKIQYRFTKSDFIQRDKKLSLSDIKSVRIHSLSGRVADLLHLKTSNPLIQLINQSSFNSYTLYIKYNRKYLRLPGNFDMFAAEIVKEMLESRLTTRKVSQLYPGVTGKMYNPVFKELTKAV